MFKGSEGERKGHKVCAPNLRCTNVLVCCAIGCPDCQSFALFPFFQFFFASLWYLVCLKLGPKCCLGAFSCYNHMVYRFHFQAKTTE